MTTKTDEQEREAFYAGWKVNAIKTEDAEHQTYLDACMEADWKEYQAGRAALQPQPVDFEDWAKSKFLPVRLSDEIGKKYDDPLTEGAWFGWSALAAMQSQPSEEAIADIVRDHLTATYVCNRVWEAWSYNTMGSDDFVEASETEMADEIAQAVVVAFGSPVLQSQDREDAFCVWHNDPETDNSWDTSCRQLFEIYDGTPTENSMKFCCYCGKPIREAIDHARRIEENE